MEGGTGLISEGRATTSTNSAPHRQRGREPAREGGEGFLAGVRVKENEPLESAIRRFKKQCEKAGILTELRKREHYEKPSVRKKKKEMAAKKRYLRRMARSGLL